MGNISVIWKHAVPTTDQLASPSCQITIIPTKKKKAYLLTENVEEFSERKKVRWNGLFAEISELVGALSKVNHKDLYQD